MGRTLARYQASKRMRTLELGEVFGAQELRLGDAKAHYAKATALPGVVEHAHHDAHFVFIIDGAYVTAADGQADYRSPRTLVYNPPDTEHMDRFASATGRFASLHVAADVIRAVAPEVRLPAAPVCIDDPIVAARFVAGALAVEADSSALDAVSSALLADIDSTPASGDAAPKWLRRATELLNDAAQHERIGIAELAAAVGVTSVHLARAFRRRHGIGPRAYARRLRMRKACALVATTRLPMAEIASLAGYADQPHFAREFKAAIGATPGVVRDASL